MSPRVVHEHYDNGSWAGWTAAITVLALVAIGLLVYFVWFAPSRTPAQTNVHVESPQPPPSAPPPNINVNPPPSAPGSGAGPSRDQRSSPPPSSGGTSGDQQQKSPDNQTGQ